MEIRRYITVAIALAAALASTAQDLSKEITIEKEIVPEQRAATRLNVSPAVSAPAVKTVRPDYSDWADPTLVAVSASRLEPAAYADSLYLSPFKGYALLGYFPAFNLGASAGYRFIDSKETLLKGWLQYDGKSYKGEVLSGDKLKFRDHTLSLGADLRQRFGTSLLDVGLRYSLTNLNNPTVSEGYSQNIHQAAIDASWSGKAGALAFNIGLGYGHFGFAKDARLSYPMETLGEDPLKPLKENSFKISLGAAADLTESSSVGLDIDADILNYNATASLSFDDAAESYALSRGEGITRGVISLKPHYLFSVNQAYAKIGARIDITFHSGKALHIAPDVKLGWIPSGFFSASLEFGGGEHVNTLGSLFDYTHYLSAIYDLGVSHIPYTVDLKLTAGPWNGASIELYGGYARANDWLMPANLSGEWQHEQMFNALDIKGWHAGAAIEYRYKQIASLRASFETAPQGYQKGYYLWRDRAKYVIEASLALTPIENLKIDVDYQYRAKRKSYSLQLASDGIEQYQSEELGAMNNLSVGAAYSLSDPWSVFARVENLLNKKCFLLYDIPAQGITGLVGVAYKF